ncbi:hypothetical protein HK097_002711 [Rhizophlyctis rosea]|uniref:C2H2-type domain-containing protein n=1 Tax=Rhizophlyctis rosea TaxID=64517 RepID=A0AAD5SLG7_9FUNG|nr:hypothetical protein HK097_002711 [Rhizophlyctis rosea]
MDFFTDSYAEFNDGSVDLTGILNTRWNPATNHFANLRATGNQVFPFPQLGDCRSANFPFSHDNYELPPSPDASSRAPLYSQTPGSSLPTQPVIAPPAELSSGTAESFLFLQPSVHLATFPAISPGPCGASDFTGIASFMLMEDGALEGDAVPSELTELFAGNSVEPRIQSVQANQQKCHRIDADPDNNDGFLFSTTGGEPVVGPASHELLVTSALTDVWPTIPDQQVSQLAQHQLLQRHQYEFSGSPTSEIIKPAILLSSRRHIKPKPKSKPKTKEMSPALYLACPRQPCRHMFTNLKSLRAHVQTHSDFRPHACSECSARFCRLPDLQRHKRSIHLVSLPYTCAGCGKGFARSDNLKRHCASKGFVYGCPATVAAMVEGASICRVLG